MRVYFKLLFALVLAVSTFAAEPSSINRIVVLGDSLSDEGNYFNATGLPPAPYFLGRASNGPLAVEKMAELYGVPLENFAWFGATTGVGNNQDGGTQGALGAAGLPGVLTVYQTAKASGLLPIDKKALYVVWAGPNDFVSDGPSVATVLTAVTNIISVVDDLQEQGAKRILVPGIPDLSLTPFVRAQGPAAMAQVSALSDAFNALLVASLPKGTTYFDTAGVFRQIVADPTAYGFNNVTDACFVSAIPSLCGNPDQYLFWDLFHPTAAVHALVGEMFSRCAQTRGGPHSRLCRVAPGRSGKDRSSAGRSPRSLGERQ